MNVTGNTRVPQYEVERSIRAVKAAAEQRQNEQAVGQARNAERAEAAQIIQSPASRDTDTLAIQNGRHTSQMDAYIPRGPRAPIADEEAGHAASSAVSAGRGPDAAASGVREPGAAEAAQMLQKPQSVEAVYTLPGQEKEAVYTLLGQKEGDADKQTYRAEPERERKTAASEDKINKEVLGLKTRLDQVQRMKRMERNPKKAENLEKQAVQIRRELLWKNSPAYRRQETMPGIA